MLIRENSLTEATKLKIFNDNQINDQGQLLGNTKNSITPASSINTNVKSQNRYESIFIKLFAQTTLQLILSFSAIFFSIVFLRDLIGLRINLFKFSFLFQFSLSLTFFIILIFAKMKFYSNSKLRKYNKVYPLSNPFEYYFNQDQLVLIGIWTVTAFNFGSWYFRQYAPHIYKLFEHIKGKAALREQCFLVWATLLTHGFVSWIIFIKRSNPIKPHDSKITLINYLKLRLKDVTFWPELFNKSSAILLSLIVIHFLFAWMTFPIFGLFLSGLLDLQHPIRHSWTSIFRIGLFVHLFTFSVISNFIYTVSDWLIEFYLGRTFRTSALVPDSEHLLTIGISKTKQSFIHLQACREFFEISTAEESNPLTFRRYKIFSVVEDEGSLSREILEWFTNELKQVKVRSTSSMQELNNFLSGTNNNELPNPEIIKQYREKTIGILELILKRVFTSNKVESVNNNVSSNINTTTNTVSNTVTNANTNSPIGLPEIFARRGPMIQQESQIDSSDSKKESLPLIFEFGPILKKYSFGKLLISYWIASRKVYCIEQVEMLRIAIKSVESFICASFVEDENGQVQLTLPKVLETVVETLKSLQSLLEISSNEFTNETILQADQQLETILDLLKEMLKRISGTFGETLENVRISTECREFIRSVV